MRVIVEYIKIVNTSLVKNLLLVINEEKLLTAKGVDGNMRKSEAYPHVVISP